LDFDFGFFENIKFSPRLIVGGNFNPSSITARLQSARLKFLTENFFSVKSIYRCMTDDEFYFTVESKKLLSIVSIIRYTAQIPQTTVVAIEYQRISNYVLS
jgi:hypothetical protein